MTSMIMIMIALGRSDHVEASAVRVIEVRLFLVFSISSAVRRELKTDESLASVYIGAVR